MEENWQQGSDGKSEVVNAATFDEGRQGREEGEEGPARQYCNEK